MTRVAGPQGQIEVLGQRPEDHRAKRRRVLTGFVKVLRDRTAQRLSDAALASSEERLRIAQQAGGVGTFEWDPVTGIVSMSEEFQRLWGLGDAVLPLTALGDLVDADDRVNVGSLRGSP